MEDEATGTIQKKWKLEKNKGLSALFAFCKTIDIPPRKRDVYKKETLKMTHVGMSRPKYLLCGLFIAIGSIIRLM